MYWLLFYFLFFLKVFTRYRNSIEELQQAGHGELPVHLSCLGRCSFSLAHRHQSSPLSLAVLRGKQHTTLAISKQVIHKPDMF